MSEREEPPKLVFMLQNKVTGEFWRRCGTKTPSIWATPHGAVNAKSSTNWQGKKTSSDWRLRVYELKGTND